MRGITFLIFLFFAGGLHAQNSYSSLFQRGYNYMPVDKEKAIELFTEALQKDKDQGEAWYYRGLAYYKTGRLQEAISDFDIALEKDSTYSLLHVYKGFAWQKLGEMDRAIDSFGAYLELHPEDSSNYAYILRGKAKMQTGDYTGALEDFESADIENDGVDMYRFISLFEKKQYTQALREIDRMIDDNPDFYGNYFYKGNTLFMMGRFRDSISEYSRSLELNSYNADAFFRRGWVQDTLRNHNMAIEDYNTAISLKSEDGTFYSRRGNAKFAAGNKEGACLDWTIAGELGYYKDFEKIKKVCH